MVKHVFPLAILMIFQGAALALMGLFQLGMMTFLYFTEPRRSSRW